MNRMVIMNLTGAETQQLNDEYMQMEKDNPLVDKNADRLLAELQNNSISDIESPQTLSLKDFSLEVYRQDLLDYFEKYKQVLERMPNGIFTGFMPPKLGGWGSEQAYSLKDIPLGRICNPAAENISICNATQADSRITNPIIQSERIANPLERRWGAEQDTLGTLERQKVFPESLIAVIGYPKRESPTDRYREIYLMCQPTDSEDSAPTPPTFTEMNRAEILDFLRKNKFQDRHLPDWIEKPNNERIAKLQAIVQEWLNTQVPQQATNAILQIAQSRKGTKPAAKGDGVRLEDKFKRENFDLIAWEYISK